MMLAQYIYLYHMYMYLYISSGFNGIMEQWNGSPTFVPSSPFEPFSPWGEKMV